MFFSKKIVADHEIRISILEKNPVQIKVSDLQAQVEALKTLVISLRGLVNRKLGMDQEKKEVPQTDFGQGGIFG